MTRNLYQTIKNIILYFILIIFFNFIDISLFFFFIKLLYSLGFVEVTVCIFILV